MSEAKTRSAASELVPLAERLRVMQLFRLGVAVVAMAFVLLTPEALVVGLDKVTTGTVAYLSLSLASELLWRFFRRRGLVLLAAMLITDGIYLAWVTYATGGTVSPLRYVILLHLIAVALLASYRTGLKLALWHSLLLFVVFYAQEAGILEPMPDSVTRLPGSPFQQLAIFIVVFWGVTIATATFSAVNERELRRRRFDLEALARMAAELERSSEPAAVAEVLVDNVVDAFSFARGAVLGIQGDDVTLMASRGGTDLAPGGQPLAGPGSVIERAREARRTLLVSDLDPHADAALVALLPGACNLVVVPLSAEGRAIGVLVVEHAMRSGSRIERRVVSALERFASQAALALRNAWLLEEVQRLATTDGLTGLANRRSFDAALEREVARAGRSDEEVTLVLLDIDHFKTFNDAHGHQQGDEVLRRVGAVLAAECREYDTPARYGGEELAVVLPRCGASDGLATAERLRQAIAAIEGPVVITASAGVATFPLHATSTAALVTAADEALYESKRAGRNRVTVASRHAPAEAPAAAFTP